MKQVLSLILSIVMLLSLFTGCNSGNSTETTAAKTSILKVGYAKVDITPTGSVPLRGDWSIRYSDGVLDSLYMTCVVFTDENDNSIVQFSLDLQNPYTTYAPWIRRDISKETGIPIEQIMVGTTHCHNAPAVNDTSLDGISDYIKFLRKSALQAVKEAMADRKDAQMSYATATPEGLNFVRHYIADDGTVVSGSNKSGYTFVGHVHKADNQLQIVKFTRNGGEDVIMANWQAHPHRYGNSKLQITSDIVGAMRDEMEAKLGCKFIYFTGASGNVNSHSLITSENVTSNYVEQGQTLAAHAIEALKSAQPAHVGKIQILKDSLITKNKKTNTDTEITDLYAYSIGELGFINAPYEMFDTNGLAIKNGSPFKMTFISTCSNNYYGPYIPEKGAWFYGESESYESSRSSFTEGTAEVLVEKYLTMLNTLYKTK